jgi:hypothetical protein
MLVFGELCLEPAELMETWRQEIVLQNAFFNLEPQNAGTYILMSHLYAMAGRWDDLKRMKMMMKERRVNKQAGCSWIEIKNSVHTFVAGDKSHPLTENIYAMLDRVMVQIKQLGFSTQTSKMV